MKATILLLTTLVCLPAPAFAETAADVDPLSERAMMKELEAYKVRLTAQRRQAILDHIGSLADDLAAKKKLEIDALEEDADPQADVRLRGILFLAETTGSAQLFAKLADHPDPLLRFVANLRLVRDGDRDAAGVLFEIMHATQTTKLQKQLIRSYAGGIGLDPASESAESIYDVLTRRNAVPKLKPGDRAPDFDVTDAAGKRVHLADLKGQLVLLHFWATSCRPCMARMPALRSELSVYPAESLAVVSISLDDDRAAFDDAIKQHDSRWISLWDGGGWGGKLARAYGVRCLPFDVIVDREGIIRSFGRETIRQLLAVDEKQKAAQAPGPGPQATAGDRPVGAATASRPTAAKGSSGAAAALPTAEQLHERLAATIERLRSVRMLFAQRSESRYQNGDAPSVLIQRGEAFLDGDRAQVRIAGGEDNPLDRADWWRGAVSSRVPLTSRTVADFTGWIYCYRPDDNPIYATIVVRPPGGPPGSVEYQASCSPQALGHFLAPFVKNGRLWEHPEMNLNGRLLVEDLAASDPKQWEVVGRVHRAGESLIEVVAMPRFEGPVVSTRAMPGLEHHGGKWAGLSIWRVWFSDDQHQFPVRIESDRRYTYNGREIPLLYTTDARFGPVFSTAGYKDYGDGLWYPESGKEVSYVAGGPDSLAEPDEIVDQFLKTGRYTVGDITLPGLIREWKVLDLKKIAPGSPLWIDPPPGAMFVDMDTATRHVVQQTGQ